MQKIATKIFVLASLTFGACGIYLVLADTEPGHQNYGLDLFFAKLLQISIFIILSSFALSVAGKYLSDRSK